MKAPTRCPPYGFCVPVTPSRNPDGSLRERDGDTALVHIRHLSLEWAIRLEDCYCYETNRGPEWQREIGRKAQSFTRDVLESADEGDLRWFVPFSNIDGENLNILKFLSFDRILGYLYVGPSQTLNRMLVSAGLASTTKGGPLGT